jgi:hypothetical protein
MGSTDMGTLRNPLRFANQCKGWRIFVVAALLLGSLISWPHLLVAQSQSQEEADGGPRVRDLWIYDTKNEVTGLPAEGYTEMVTEVSPKEVVVNRTFREPVYRRPQNYIVIYDHDWNVIDNSDHKFKSNDGTGVRMPLSIGKTWQAEFDAQDLHTTRRIYRGTSSSKVVAQEMITTDAGTFDAFKIEQQARWLDPLDPSRMWEFQIVTWFSPQINHWVRRTNLIKFEKRVRDNTTEELVDFNRKL